MIYIIFLGIFIFFAAYNFINQSGWLFDSIISIIFITFIFLISKWIKLGRIGFILLNLALIAHNLGSFDFYSWNLGWFSYDDAVHLFSSIIVAYIIFNFIARKLCIKEGHINKRTVVNEHKVILIFLVIASVATLGTLVETLEYFGFTYLGPGEGILFVGSGDYNKFGDIASQYVDTMQDIIMNTIGSIVGVLFYNFSQYKKNFVAEQIN